MNDLRSDGKNFSCRISPIFGLLISLCLCGLGVSVSAQSDLPDVFSLEQRVAQMFIVNLYGRQLNDSGRDFLRQWQPGGVVLLDDNAGTPEEVTRLTNSYQQTITQAGGLPLFIAADQEPGAVTALENGFTQFPTPTLITATADPHLAFLVGQAIAEEMSAVGLNVNFAPVADLETNPNNPIIKRRSFGTDPSLVSPMIAAFVSGLQSSRVLATVKHFPGHGDTATDSHTSLPVIDLPKDRLETVELAPFRAAVMADVAAVMVAHVWYPALDTEANRPASLSSPVITGLLRETMGYKGLIVTDALDMDAVDTRYAYPEAALMAVQAGADLILSAHVGPNLHAQAIERIVAAVRTGEIAEARINQSFQRILEAKQRYGILDWQPLDPASVAQRLKLNQHTLLIEELFRHGITIVYDRQALLPPPADHSIALIYPATRVQIANECGALRPDIRRVGVSDSPSDEEIAWAQDAARRSDVVIVFTQNAVDEHRQQVLVNALPQEKTVVVALWSPYDWTVFSNVAAFLATYSPARPAVPAACAILFGVIPAQGQLPILLSEALPPGSRVE